MKTPNEIKDDVAKSHGYEDWILLLHSFTSGLLWSDRFVASV